MNFNPGISETYLAEAAMDCMQWWEEVVNASKEIDGATKIRLIALVNTRNIIALHSCSAEKMARKYSCCVTGTENRFKTFKIQCSIEERLADGAYWVRDHPKVEIT